MDKTCSTCAWYEIEDSACYNSDSDWGRKITNGEKHCGCWEAKPEENSVKHRQICDRLHEIYRMKNLDYGNSFHDTFIDEGVVSSRIRIGDKYRRFCTLTKNNTQNVKDESVVDTLLDLANYAIMTVMEIENEPDRKE